jgi:CheY-like chemotaxis protein/HAMP domain-containing protein/putative methionine-R-sulfoxide reductase with GAF domain
MQSEQMVNGTGTTTLDTTRMLEALVALQRGNFSVRLPLEWTGMAGKIADTFNDVIEQNERMAAELSRLSQAVGKEGRITERASIGDVSGSWAASVASVNMLIGDLVHPTSETARVIGAVAKGDLSQTMALEMDGRPLQGEFLRTAKTVNRMVTQLSSFASEVTRVAREVGTEGKLGGQADVQGVAGTWKDLTDNVNLMAGNLTDQVRNIAAVTTAVANGDLSKKITVAVKGEILELKNTINTMVDQLNSFASEVTRVAREVGTEGKLGGQADVRGVAGTWKDLTDSVNSMAGNLTSQVRNIAAVTTAVANGDLSKKITVDVKGEILELKNTVNTMVDQLNSFASEVTRVAREVGTEGKLGGQADVQGVAGTWKDLTDSVNSMAGNLTSQVRNIAAVTTAVANGDLSKKITVDVKGEILELKNTINTMVDQLNSFASEVTRVAREVGTEGKLGGQALVGGVSGTWKDLTDNVNFMAGNLTSQVRGIAKVVTAVANGDLKRKLTVEAKGEIAALADTINGMTDTLAIFADQVTTVAREVGVEGKLGGQASVPGAAGTWKDLTDNVNQLAANLTTQVRAIADVATAVTKGDLTRSIQVAAQGEVAALKDNINEMIRNLKDTTLKNSEQDWLKTNLAKFSRMLQGQKDMLTVGKLILSELAPVVTAQQAVFYIVDSGQEDNGVDRSLKLLANYAYTGQERQRFRFGESLVGQCALEKQKILLNVPSDYIKISSGLGESTAHNVMVLPVLFEGQVKGVLELASFERFSPTHQMFLDQLMESIGIVLNTIEANMRTENLLEQSQSLANELQIQQQELQKTNQELQEKAKLLADQNVEVERKNQEVEQARKALEEKAEQLALTSKYKSEFLANMSHELRTPLNSLLILSDQLTRNQDGNLTPKQVEFSQTIHDSGKDLLALINDILDLSKIESGTVTVDVSELAIDDLQDYVERTFRHVAESRKLDFTVEVAPSVPREMQTDAKRLQQVLKNLLSNAFKFTEQGMVKVRIDRAEGGWSPDNELLNRAKNVLAFSVSDTGIGIPVEKQQIIFEAFQQADGSTSRRYGGTGLGLAISREISRLLGGEIKLQSQSGIGSTFTLYVPKNYAPSKVARRMAVDLEPMPQAYTFEAPPLPTPEPTLVRDQIEDDRRKIKPGDKTVLIVDNDVTFARYMLEMAHKQGFKALVTAQGGIAVNLAREYRPNAITLDIRLPDIDGWRVLNHMKSDLKTRHIPVRVISTDDERVRGFKHGAVEVLQKPVETSELEQMFARINDSITQQTRRLLIVEDNEVQRNTMVEWLSSDDVETRAVETGKEALDLLVDERFDCSVIDLGLPDMSGVELIETINRQPALAKMPIVIYTARDLTRKEGLQLRRIAKSVIVKDAGSMERLLDETALYMHRPHENLPETQRAIIEQLHKPHVMLANKRVLVVDDDVRNIFAMTTLLEQYRMKVLSADNGRTALETLEKTPGISIVLMDIMMPGMDGYETMRAIRKLRKFRSLPIIALTAKAMKGDREKCIEAGASDYIAKPVDEQELLSLLGVWLYR